MQSLRALSTALVLTSLIAHAQWQQVPVPSTMDLFSINALDAQHLIIGASGSCLRTANGGATWDSLPLSDASGIPLLGSAFLAMRYRSSTELYGTGIYFLNTYPFQVRRSTNAGGNWPTVYSAPGNGAFTAMRSMAFWGTTTTGVAVGDLGRIVRTANGTTWTLENGTGSGLKDVCFASATTVVAVGNERILRSTDGGLNWSTVYTGNNLQAVHFPTATLGFAADYGDDLLRTTNGGVNWAPLGSSLPVGLGAIVDLHFTSSTEGFALTEDRILHTMDGGLHWEWFPCANDMQQLHMLSAADGWAVGHGATVYRTGGTGSYHPTALFDAPTSVACVDSAVTFINRSAPGLSSQWLINGTAVGSSTDLTWTFTEPQQVDTVMLVVGNGTWSDTVAYTVSVGTSLQITLAATMNSDTVCSGQGTQIVVPNAQAGTQYRLYRGATPQGNAQTGNGATLTFSTGNIIATQPFHLVATRYGGTCGIATDTLHFLLHTGNPDAALAVAPGPTEACPGDTVDMTIAASETAVNYQLRRNNVNVGTPQAGTGGTLTFPVGPLQDPGTYTFVATHQNGCTSTLQQSVPISIQRPHLAWGATALNPEAGTPVDLMNTSNVLAGTYLWLLGANATPATSTAAEPSDVTFDALGPHAVQLIGITPQGCRDTLTRIIHAVPPGVTQECGVSQLAIPNSEADGSCVAFDGTGNLFAFHMLNSSNAVATFSGAGDTLYTQLPKEPDYQVHGVLLKYDPFGRPQWFVDLWSDTGWPKHGDVHIDAQGNVYTAYFHGDYLDSLRIVDAAGAMHTINPPSDYSSQHSVVVTSFDANGRFRWVNTFLSMYTCERVNIELDDAGHVYVQSTDRLVKFDAATGEQVWELVEYYGFRDFALDATGIWVAERMDMQLKRVLLDGTVDHVTVPYAATPPVSGLTRNQSELMEGDGTGNLYELNLLFGEVVVGNDTITGAPSTVNNVYFVCKFDASGSPVWTWPFALGRNSRATGMAVSGGRIVIQVQAAMADSLRIEGLPVVPVHTQDQWVVSVGTDGEDPHAALIYRPNGPAVYGFYAQGENTIAFDLAGGRLALWVPFNSTLTVGNDTAESLVGFFPNEAPTGNRQTALVHGALDCLLPGMAAGTVVPFALFTPSTGQCAGETVSFTDHSLGLPTAWQWEFPNGVPESSTEAAPTVVYADAGVYQATLTVSNAAGTSMATTMEVLVDVCTGIAKPDREQPSLAPNPTQDRVAFQGLGQRTPALCTDMQGRVVWTGWAASGTVLDVSAWPAGAYLLLVERPEGAWRAPLIIAR